MTAPRPTLRDIALKAGCHYSTVSLALRDDTRIASSTRTHVQRIARQLGYEPDAMMAALSAYRVMKRPTGIRSVIAWVTNHSTRHGWRESPCNRDYFEGASGRARERGYQLEAFWLAEPGMTGFRMSDILRTRGIKGVLLPPQERLCGIEFDWQDFAAVTLGYTLVEPRLHIVTNHEYRTMGSLFSELSRRRYRRIGLVNLRDQDARVDHNWLAAYLVEQHLRVPNHQLPPLIMDRWDEKDLLRWVRASRPDAIVTKLPPVLAALKRGGYSVPEDVGVAFHTLDDHPSEYSGMKKNAHQIGIMAVDTIVDMIHRNERGVPALPHLLMVEGSWVEGATLRAVDASALAPGAAVVGVAAD